MDRRDTFYENLKNVLDPERSKFMMLSWEELLDVIDKAHRNTQHEGRDILMKECYIMGSYGRFCLD